jgi:hypothetical protein
VRELKVLMKNIYAEIMGRGKLDDLMRELQAPYIILLKKRGVLAARCSDGRKKTQATGCVVAA